jgi:hypothetical protein
MATNTLTLRMTGRWPAGRALLALAVATVLFLAAAGGAWAWGQHRYGQMLYEWRWRNQVRGARSAGVEAPGGAGISFALLLLQWHSPDGATLEGGDGSCRSCSGCSAYPSA